MIPVMVPNDVWAILELGAKKNSIKAAARATILFIDLSSEERFSSNTKKGQQAELTQCALHYYDNSGGTFTTSKLKNIQLGC